MEEYNDIKDLLKPKRTIKATPDLRQRVHAATAMSGHNKKSLSPWFRSIAAACAVLVLGITFIFVGEMTVSQPADNTDCIVFVSGQRVSADNARAVAEADVARMHHFITTVAMQNAAEEEKVNKFLQHKNHTK